LPPRVRSTAEDQVERILLLEHEFAFEQIVTMRLAAPTSEARKDIPGREGCLEIIPHPKAPLAHLGRVGSEETVEVTGEGETDPALGCARSIFR
jgi:hypothetical protein